MTRANENTSIRLPTNSSWQKLRRHPYTIAAAIYLIFNAIRFMVIKDFSEWDHVYVLAATHLLHGSDIYSVVPEAQDHAYSYPPFMAMLAIPFTYLPEVAGKFIWFLINAICAVLAWRWAWRLSGGQPLEGPRPAPAREHVICILGLLCAMRFMEDNFNHRQTDLLIAVLLLGGCMAWKNSRDFGAATCFAIAAAMKGPALLFAPYLLWRGRWKTAAWMIIVAIGVNLLPDLVHRAPQEIWLTHWYETMVKPIDNIGLWHSAAINNQSIAGAARRWFALTWQFGADGMLIDQSRPDALSPAALKKLVYAIEMILLILTAKIMGRPGQRPRDSASAVLECSILFGLMLLLSPMSSNPHFCIILLPAFCVARHGVQQRNRLSQIALGICIFAVIVLDRSIVQRRAGALAMWYGSVMWGSLGLTVACAAALRKKDRST